MRIAILDDEKQHIEVTRKIVQKFFGKNEAIISCYETKKELDKAFGTSPHLFDILVLDIRLTYSDGIEVAKEIRKVNEKCRIIFLSNYLEFATEVYETEHTFFVLKSDAVKKLPIALERAVKQLEKRKQETVDVKISNTESRIVEIEDILYIEKERRKTIVHMVDDVLESSSNPLDNLEEPKKKYLLRCYRSLWVNPVHIRRITANEITLSNSCKIPLGRSFAKTFRSSFMAYATDGSQIEN